MSVVCPQGHRKFHDGEDVQYTDVGNPATIIICCHNPTNFSDDSDALEFYNTVSEVIKKLLGNNLYVSRDCLSHCTKIIISR